MLSNQILHKALQDIRSITGFECSVWDAKGGCLVRTKEDAIDLEREVKAFCGSGEEQRLQEGKGLFLVCDDQEPEYVLALQGEGEELTLAGRLGASQLGNLILACKERMDKSRFIQNLLLDNLLLVDIYSRAKKLHIPADANRVVMIIESGGGRDGNVLEVVRAGFSANSHDFITAVDENNVIVVKTLTEIDENAEIKQAAASIAAYLENEGILNSRISYGTVVREIKEVSRSYKEAKMAMDVGKIFFDERMIIAYSELGIGRLIYQLPIPQCRMFIREIFGGKSPDDFDEETLTTINKFFENSLNVSETSRQLFIHRNTLVYRLDKLQKSTGLDLRVFEDAITFKIALMVVKYMKYMESLEY